ncbi:hypothetical protein ACTXT7_010361 [Hymenolepis weldensis]
MSPEFAELVLDIIPKLSETPYVNLKLVILVRVEKSDSQPYKRLLAEMHNSSMTITPERVFDIEQFHRERFKELPLIAGASNPKCGEKKQYPPKQAPATQKKRARRKSNAQKPEVTAHPKLSLPKTQH